MHQDDYFKGYDREGAPNIIEDRISDIFVPLSEKVTGKPDMIIFGESDALPQASGLQLTNSLPLVCIQLLDTGISSTCATSSCGGKE